MTSHSSCTLFFVSRFPWHLVLSMDIGTISANQPDRIRSCITTGIWSFIFRYEWDHPWMHPSCTSRSTWKWLVRTWYDVRDHAMYVSIRFSLSFVRNLIAFLNLLWNCGGMNYFPLTCSHHRFGSDHHTNCETKGICLYGHWWCRTPCQVESATITTIPISERYARSRSAESQAKQKQ